MKKRLFITIFVLSAFCAFSLGNNISDIGFSFCDQTDKDKTINVQAGEVKTICFNFYSKAYENIQIKYGFTKGFIKSSNGLRLCDQQVGNNNDFSKLFVDMSGQNRNLSVPPQGSITINETIKAPKGINGIVYGCLVFETSKPTDSKIGGIFILNERKSIPLTLFIGGSKDIQTSIRLLNFTGQTNSFSSVHKANIHTTNNKTNISFLVKNDGNITQEVKIQGKISNILGFEKKFETTKHIISAGNTMQIDQQIGILPSYKGPFKITFETEATPYLDFDQSNIDAQLKTTIHIENGGYLFIFSRVWIVLSIIGIGIIYITFKPLFKKQ